MRHLDCPICGKHVRLSNLHTRTFEARALGIDSGGFVKTNTHSLAHFRSGEGALIDNFGRPTKADRLPEVKR